jgi:hypothetical protein
MPASDGALAAVAARLDVVALGAEVLAAAALKLDGLAGGARTRGTHHDAGR